LLLFLQEPSIGDKSLIGGDFIGSDGYVGVSVECFWVFDVHLFGLDTCVVACQLDWLRDEHHFYGEFAAVEEENRDASNKQDEDYGSDHYSQHLLGS
jgi:hypothetical protein